MSDVSGTLTVDERDPVHSHVTVTIGTRSLDTNRPARDTHLRSADFFDVARSPTMTFTSQRIEALDQAAGHYRVTGMLTIRHRQGARDRPERKGTSAKGVSDHKPFLITWTPRIYI